jgi:hypothetical protein
MLKVYCDTGAFRDELRDLEREGKVRIFQFKYENKNKHVRHMAAPSRPSWKEINYTWSELTLTWDALGKTSHKRQEIETLLGPNSIRDAKHLDSAYMEGCRAFLTSDKRDIVSRRDELRSLLGIEVFHFHVGWEAFLAFVAEAG